MYESKAILPAHGQLKIVVQFITKDTTELYYEVGYSQSVNVANHVQQMFEEAILNALYKLNHRRGDQMFNKNNYNEDIKKYVTSYVIKSYIFRYYEDRRYTYKRERRTDDKGKSRYTYIIRRDGVEFEKVRQKTLRRKNLSDIEDKAF